jgi:hypothetical protein
VADADLMPEANIADSVVVGVNRVAMQQSGLGELALLARCCLRRLKSDIAERFA